MDMNYDFTTRVNRRETGSYKWDAMVEQNPKVEEGVLPLSVADMEFKNAPEIYEGLIEFLKQEPVLGYTGPTDDYLQAVVDWQEKRHQWKIEKEWIVPTPGVVAALNIAIQAFTKEKEGVIIFQPVYHPFHNVIVENNRALVNVPLIEEAGDYTIDFEAFEEAAAKTENKLLIFCSPHNPVGRVWTEEELARLADIAVQHDLYVISDEVWYDFVRSDKTHTVLHHVDPALHDKLITCTSASKTFNLAGGAISNIMISDEALRENFLQTAQKLSLTGINIFGFEATELAYTKSEEWLDKLLEVIYDNQEMVKTFFEEHYPKVKAPVSEGTYVQWLDFRALGVEDEELDHLLRENQCFTNPGHIFGEEGSGFQRINVALPKEALNESLERMLKALKSQETIG